uniref:Uncharacterized protein n=1 Tax=Brassica oleracea TaxID=3712 RepID=A0A3P6GXL4_BRAOL|nr:unnamed protein product [Brassica oleracea]
MECVVQGIIETQHVEALEILLQGLYGVQRQRLRVVPTAAAALMLDGGTTL